jgi:hypothetical protein
MTSKDSETFGIAVTYALVTGQHVEHSEGTRHEVWAWVLEAQRDTRAIGAEVYTASGGFDIVWSWLR